LLLLLLLTKFLILPVRLLLENGAALIGAWVCDLSGSGRIFLLLR
jgi:hypothetical protein